MSEQKTIGENCDDTQLIKPVDLNEETSKTIIEAIEITTMYGKRVKLNFEDKTGMIVPYFALLPIADKDETLDKLNNRSIILVPIKYNDKEGNEKPGIELKRVVI